MGLGGGERNIHLVTISIFEANHIRLVKFELRSQALYVSNTFFCLCQTLTVILQHLLFYLRLGQLPIEQVTIKCFR